MKTEVHPISQPPHSSLAPAHKSLSRTFFPGLHEPETRQRPNGLRAPALGALTFAVIDHLTYGPPRTTLVP